MGKLDFIYKRRSVRNFLDADVPADDLREILKAAIYAPSGKNLQNWHFVVVKNKAKIAEMAQIVERKNAELAELLPSEEKRKAFRGMVAYHTVFKKAPVVILVYAGPYPTLATDLAEAKAAPLDLIHALARPNPGVQNIAAAMENLLLAAANLGYGTCWMTGPTYAAEEISKLVGFTKPGYYLAAMTPLGVPADDKGTNPPRKPLDEVVTFIE
ncbi:nitroreductase [Thermosinus carboxydivorans Nor1]|uniref:Nitroreductase n=1 Tax=Thermosinus carboxydivorans Nor1 TaxID=401526 RepID=A1HTF0_9FIRM|nr:nitroreductase family protein [Thermosinus carboxydivorans]EAX46699.1 nitroreductase [Thermosinus carboxydivorans Nor1]